MPPDMRPLWIVAALFAFTACKSSSPRRQTQWGPPQGQFVPRQAPPPTYQMPFAVPAAPGTAPGPAFSAAVPAPPPPASVVEADKCVGAEGSLADCTAALEKLGASPTATGDKTLAVYKKACELKGKLLGCGAFKSTAVDLERDKSTLELLALCDAGRWESCEDVKTKSAPLQAWLSTLKTNGCKKGETALCKNYRECKAPTRWGCVGADQKLCGCLPKCGGTITGTPKTRSWPDGSTRGNFTCSN